VRTRAFAAYGLGLIAYRSSSNQQRQDIALTLLDILNAPQFAQRDIKVAAMTAFGLCPIDSNPEAPPPTEEKLKENPNNQWIPSRETQLAFLLDYFDPAKEMANKNTRHWFVRAHAPAAMARLLDGQGEAQREQVAKALLGGIETSSPRSRARSRWPARWRWDRWPTARTTARTTSTPRSARSSSAWPRKARSRPAASRSSRSPNRAPARAPARTARPARRT
jgi:hypothetical protein